MSESSNIYTLRVKILPQYQDDQTIIKHYSERPNYKDDAGVDLILPNDILGENVPHYGMMVGMGIQCEMLDPNDQNCAYDLRPRSSIYKTPFRLCNSVGTIDKNYRGEICAVFDRLYGSAKYEKGNRLVQICAPGLNPIRVQLVNNLSETERGEKGFGSTGK